LDVSGNLYTLKNTTVPTLSRDLLDVSGNLYTLKNTFAGITGNVSSVKFTAEAIFTKTADLWNIINTATTSIDYSVGGSTVSLDISSAGPYSYNIRNVPDLSKNSHILTVFTKAGALNTSTCYGNIITVNTNNAYTLLWNNGENPVSTMSGVQVGDIVTQQIALLPMDFSRNVAISSVSFYRRG
jgi:hypothetical protein